MPSKAERVELLQLEAAQHMADAQEVLRREDLGEMKRQIAQCGHMEQAYNKLQQVAILTNDKALLKTTGEQATKWATNMRAATTKRRNDVVPILVNAVAGNATWSEALKDLKAKELI